MMIFPIHEWEESIREITAAIASGLNDRGGVAALEFSLMKFFAKFHYGVQFINCSDIT